MAGASTPFQKNACYSFIYLSVDLAQAVVLVFYKGCQEIHETCHSVTFYFMKKPIFGY